MEDAIEQLQTKDTKERMAGVERLKDILEHSRKGLSANEVSSLVDASLVLLEDNNFRVSQGTLQALASAAALAGEHLKLHFNSLLPAIVERLGDGKQPVRDAGRQLLLALMEISSPTIVVERARNFAWGHRKWRVREEFARTVASAVNLFAATELPFLRMLLPSVLQLLEDSHSSVREAAMLCLEEMYRQGGTQFRDELQSHQLRPAQLKDIISRFNGIEPVRCSFESVGSQQIVPDDKQVKDAGQCTISERKVGAVVAAPTRRNSLRVKAATQSEPTSVGGREVGGESQVDAIRIYSEKELVKEMEKAASLLTPDRDWSVRIAAMQRIEGFVAGGATEYASFNMLMKHLVGPLNGQLADRRSSIVKQACQLLNLLSRELLVNFEAFAESFIPVLFKLVVITVLVIAESADICIKTMLRHCRVSRVLPKLVESAKHDRNAVLRVRCCEYALLVLEQWGDSPEIQRSVELYEELIKCCVGDAVSEVRCCARNCYRVFMKCWPERAHRIFVTFDPAVQRLLNEEGGVSSQKRYAFPPVEESGSEQQQPSRQSSNLALTAARQQAAANHHTAAYSNSTSVNPDRSASITAALGNSMMHRSYQGTSAELGPARSTERVLQASQQQVNAIETMLRGGSKFDKSGSSAATGSHESMAGINDKGSLPMPSKIARRDPVGGGYLGLYGASAANHVGVENPSGTTARRVAHDNSTMNYSDGNVGEIKGPKRVMRMEYADKNYTEEKEMDSPFIPGFQRPLVRGRASGSTRNSIDENPVLAQFNAGGEMQRYTEVLVPLTDALSEGLSVAADWSVRVAAFTFLRKVMEQGPKGLQEIMQNFAMVMKLFSAHLDDPHHKVAHAALSTLAELIPACRKPFEAYLERILPHVFGRLVDSKEVIRQLGSTVLEVVGSTYSFDSLLPALLRSLDEQRSPKAKMAIIEFAIVASTKLALNGETSGTGLLKMWLAKLGPLAHCKTPKLKEAAVTGIISVYSHLDSTIVLNFILGLSIEEQSLLRRSLKQYTPRIEVDLMTYLQNKTQRGRPKFVHDHADSSTSSISGISPESLKSGSSSLAGNQSGVGYSMNSVNRGSSRKGESVQHDSLYSVESINRLQIAASELTLETFQNCETSGSTHESSGRHNSFHSGMMKEVTNGEMETDRRSELSVVIFKDAEDLQGTPKSRGECNKYPLGDSMDLVSCEERVMADSYPDSSPAAGLQPEAQVIYDDKFVRKVSSEAASEDPDSNVLNLLQEIAGWGSVKPSKKKYETLMELIMLRDNEPAAWSEYFNEIFMVILESMDDPDVAVKELALSATFDILSSQKSSLEESTEGLLEKVIQSSLDPDTKVSAAADRCRTIVLTEFDPHRCLEVLVQLLVSDEERLLITCIRSLTLLVNRLAPDKLIAQLPSFLPALFRAFSNPNADVRKTVVFCLVDIYIALGEAFVPHLGGLSSTQLRLVTIYANRISQARMESVVEPGN